MTSPENRQRIAELELARKLDRHLAKSIPFDSARDALIAEIMRTPSGRAACMGTLGEPPMDELAREVQATEMGQRVMELVRYHEGAEASAQATTDEARLAEIAALTDPQAKINAWRAYQAERGQ